MRRRLRFWGLLIVFVIAAASALIWLTCRSGFPDPAYQGRRLSRWLDDAYAPDTTENGRVEPSSVTAAEEALHGLGANAFPCLLAMSASRDSAAKRKLEYLVGRQAHVGIRMVPADDRHQEAIAGFHVLRAEAGPEIPALSKQINDSNSSDTVAVILADLGPDAIGPLTNALANPDAHVRASALMGLGLLTRPLLRINTSDNSAVLDSEAKLMVPALVNSLSNNDAAFRLLANDLLGRLSREPAQVVPALIHELSDPDVVAHRTAATALAKFGANAEPAVPALLQSLTNSDSSIRFTAADALKAIDPDAALKAGLKPWQ